MPFLRGKTNQEVPVVQKAETAASTRKKGKKDVYCDIEKLLDAGLPLYKADGKSHEKGSVNYTKMRQAVKLKRGTLCAGCAESGSTECPAVEVTRECAVWNHYIEKAEAMDEGEEEREEESDTETITID
ncbi:hypothetical protein E4U53_005274 [Claviceps sorghi]|nr:hypothetical protein E4U53_005274 [Claviceps sorghi]